jgi:hypothetical protein
MCAELSPETWMRVSRLLDRVLDLPPAERRACLERSCADDAEERRWAEALIEAADRAGPFLEDPSPLRNLRNLSDPGFPEAPPPPGGGEGSGKGGTG